MYLGDKNVRFTVRVSRELADYIYKLSDNWHSSPSDVIRLILTVSQVHDEFIQKTHE